jgi:hypothetical protein
MRALLQCLFELLHGNRCMIAVATIIVVEV